MSVKKGIKTKHMNLKIYNNNGKITITNICCGKEYPVAELESGEMANITGEIRSAIRVNTSAIPMTAM